MLRPRYVSLAMVQILKWEAAFQSRDDLQQYAAEGLGLFALALRFGVEDLITVAADAITDGPDDKKIDIIYIDRSQKSAFVMQCYRSESNFDRQAPANKATDLHTAVSYALSVTEANLPERIRSQVVALREAIRDGAVDTLYIWYVHNRTENSDIAAELAQVEITAQGLLAKSFSEVSCKVFSQEIGRATLEDWYGKSSSQIIVTDEIEFQISDSFEKNGPSWKCLVASIKGRKLSDLYDTYNKDLFSLNVRDYLGVVKKDANVNHNIKGTASSDPEHFWAFNNGITAIVHDYQVGDRVLRVRGLAIVNGAQTTGALGNLEAKPSDSLDVPARFFKTADQDLIDQIIRFTNSQNSIEASDFRSTDSIQRRLRDEFQRITNADYEGGRRGSVSDAIKRRPNLLPSFTVGQALSAFHGDPVIAYNEKSRIWNDNDAYNRIFNDQTTASHIVLCFSLLRSIELAKHELMAKSKSEASLLDQDQKKLDFFRMVGSQFLLISTIANSLELILDQPVPNRFRVAFRDGSVPEGVSKWTPIVDVFLAFAPRLSEFLREGLKGNERARAAALDVRQTLDSIKQYHQSTYSAFKKSVVIS